MANTTMNHRESFLCDYLKYKPNVPFCDLTNPLSLLLWVHIKPFALIHSISYQLEEQEHNFCERNSREVEADHQQIQAVT
ncbi:Hypothetical predicted protein [Octopus vulgaris]|uniref:Uncharacterized protein n=1 Tax=Octopus vulgaris TaxID=6645 RepID=A0AA36ANA4_OCTVU|nr:Hypothetical predicted protein [Octopus vulgaris]